MSHIKSCLLMTIGLTLLLLSAGCAKSSFGVLNYRSIRPQSLIFCEEGQLVKKAMAYELIPSKFTITNELIIARLMDDISHSTEIGDYSAIGYLAQFVALDKLGEPVAYIGVLCHKSTIIIEPCIKRNNRFLISIDPLTEIVIIRARSFVDEVYSYMEVYRKDELERIRGAFSLQGLDLEMHLFGSNKATGRRGAVKETPASAAGPNSPARPDRSRGEDGK